MGDDSSKRIGIISCLPVMNSRKPMPHKLLIRTGYVNFGPPSLPIYRYLRYFTMDLRLKIKILHTPINLLRFKTNANVLNPLYLFHLMVSDHGQALIERCITRTAKKTITAKDIAALRIPIPPIQRQKEFAQRVAEIRELEAGQVASRRRLEALFQSILHSAFQGEL